MKGMRLLRAKSELDLSSRCICRHKSKLVAKELAVNTTTKTLLLSKNYLTNEGSENIAGALMKNRTLTTIGLDTNHIFDAGCKAIAAALLQNNVLTNLFLNDNQIGPAGAICLAQTLRRNDGLQQLGLGQNTLGNDGALAIGIAMHSNTSLSRLEMHGSSIADMGALTLLKSLKEYNSTLKSLTLQDNPGISSHVQQPIDFVLASRRVLESFLRHMRQPLDKRIVPLAVRTTQERAVLHEAAAGPIFYLVRATALRDAKVIKETTSGYKRSRVP
jgi:Leucine Rich repeat